MGLNLGQMVLALKDNLSKERRRDKADYRLLMVAFMKVNLKMTNYPDKVIIATLMGDLTKEVG